MKLAIVFGVVLFASAGNAFSWTEALREMQKSVQEVTDSVISKIETQFEATQTKAEAETVELTDETNKFGSKISDELASVVKNFNDQLKELGYDVHDDVVKECNKSGDETLAKLSKAVTDKTGECINSKLDSGVEYVESIKNVSNDVLDKISEIKEKAQHCGDDLENATSVFSAIFCSKSTAANATWVTLKAAPKLTASWTKLKFLLITLQPSLNLCTKNERVNLQLHSAIILKNTKECIQQKVAHNSTPKVHKSQEDFA